MHALDTNVLVYRLNRGDPIKQAQARELIRQLNLNPTPTVLLWQVLAEFMRYLWSWHDQNLIPTAAVAGYVNAVRRLFPLVLPTSEVVDHALDYAGRFSLSHGDSMIVGACRAAGVTTLYAEDMGAPVTFDTVRLVNPFGALQTPPTDPLAD